jgi:hypothetical protein
MKLRANSRLVVNLLPLFSILPLALASGEQSSWVSALAEKTLKSGSLHKQNDSRL